MTNQIVEVTAFFVFKGNQPIGTEVSDIKESLRLLSLNAIDGDGKVELTLTPEKAVQYLRRS